MIVQDISSTEDESNLRIESIAISNIRGVPRKLKIIKRGLYRLDFRILLLR